MPCANETLEMSSLKLAAETLSADKFKLNGVLTILEKVPGPLDVSNYGIQSIILKHFNCGYKIY